MRRLVNGMVVAATIALAGCASAHRPAATVGASSRYAVETIRVCESLVYYAPEDDRQATLHCANILDIWH